METQILQHGKREKMNVYPFSWLHHTHHLVQHSHWDHCLDSWKSPGKPHSKTTVSFIFCVRTSINLRNHSPGWLWGCWTKGHVRWHDGFDLQCIGRPASTQQNTLDRNHHRYSPAGAVEEMISVNICKKTSIGAEVWCHVNYTKLGYAYVIKKINK